MTGPVCAGQKVASEGCEETAEGQTDDHRVLLHYQNISMSPGPGRAAELSDVSSSLSAPYYF